MSELDTLCYICEQTSYPEDYGKNDFGYKITKSEADGRFYVEFDAVLHSFGDMNRNGRSYDADNVWDRICNDEAVQSHIKHNNWIGELDHPAAHIQGQELTVERISTPDMERSSHFIRKPFLTPDKRLLRAHIQSDSSTDQGMNMAIKITDGKIIPCFSARVLGALQKRNNIPTVFVRKLITYDWVLFPSHARAHADINQPIVESALLLSNMAKAKIIYLAELARMAANNDKQVQWLCESFNIEEKDLLGVTETGNSVVLTENGNVYMQPISDKNIRRKTYDMVQDWINQ